MFRYHVTFGVEKKVVTADDKTTLRNVILQEFSVGSSPFVLQSWDVEFEDWVNVTDVSQLPDKCKLQVVVKDTESTVVAAEPAQPSPQQPAAVPHVDLSEPSGSRDATGRRQWPLVYCLPQLPRQLREELEAVKSVVQLSSSTTHRFVRVLYEDIIQYTLYPTSHQYSEVCTAILQAFPMLRDRVVHEGAGSSQPHRTWMSLLTTKFKYERQKLNDIAEVKACRKKFASKRRSAVNDGNDDGDNGTAKRCRRVDPQDIPGAEDDGTLSAHITAMNTEMSKSVPNTALIDDRMNRTLAARRQAVINKPLLELLEEYPALKLDDQSPQMLHGMQQINSEVTRMTGIDVRAKLSKFMTASRVDSILKLVSRGKVDQLLLDVAEAPGKSANYDVQTQRLGCALLLLPAAFKEPCTSWFSLNKETGVLTPSLEVQVDSLNDIFNLDEVEIYSVLDKKRVTHPADFLSAIASVICFYWVFDVAFPKQLSKTIAFLAGHVCRLMPFKAVPALQKVLNHIYD